MNLWQIRHIPNSWRKLVNLTLLFCIGLVAAWWGGFGVDPVRGQGDAKPASAKNAESDAAATEFMKRVHQSLYDHSSIQAEIEQTVTIAGQQFLASGQYLSAGSKMRLAYNIKPDQGISGALLEICDGKDLWSSIRILDSTRVTHRDVQQIKAAIAGTKTVTDAVLTAELGLGGLPGLVASLERTMTFEAMKEESGDAGSSTIIKGKWKTEYHSKLPKGKDGAVLSYVPDLIRITVDPQTMFPTRIVYVKIVVEKEKKVFRPLVSLKFKNVAFDKPIGDQEFTFVPPDRVVPEDITRQYLDRIKKSTEDAVAAEAANLAKPAANPGSAPK